MSLSEFLTIYLAIGAPFGVYYFLKERGETVSLTLILKSVGAALIWFLFAPQLFKERLLKVQIAPPKAALEFFPQERLETISQNLQNAFAEFSKNEISTSYFEFRETLERYIGLTLAVQNSSLNGAIAEHELAVFRLARREKRDLQIAGKIIHRKNYLRLQQHLAIARRDFLGIYHFFNENFATQKNVENIAWQQYQIESRRLAELLKDAEVKQVLQESGQTFSLEQTPVFDLNKAHKQNLWKTV